MAIPLISLLHEAAEMVLKAEESFMADETRGEGSFREREPENSNSKEEMIFCHKVAMRSKKSKKKWSE